MPQFDVWRDHRCALGRTLSFPELAVGLLGSRARISIVPLLPGKCLGKNVCSLLSGLNVLDADTATRRQLFRSTAQIHSVSPAYMSELRGVSFFNDQNGSLIVLVGVLSAEQN